VHQLANDLPNRLVIAHLGNGASVTAVKAGKSIDTSMGLTPTGGVIMGTRSGDLDPGVLVYLMREKKFDAAMLEELVDHRSGLLGISGIGSDMRRLHEAASSNADARLAIAMFCYSVRKQVAAMIAALGGVDLLVFTGGIGENDADGRDRQNHERRRSAAPTCTSSRATCRPASPAAFWATRASASSTRSAGRHGVQAGDRS
jgi:acetate kinase